MILSGRLAPLSPSGRVDNVTKVCVLDNYACIRVPWPAKVYSVCEAIVDIPVHVDGTVVDNIPRRAVGRWPS